MFTYYVTLGFRSLSNQRLITAWMMLLIALGVSGTVSTFALLRAVSSNPFAGKSHTLFIPQIDNRGPDYLKIARRLDPLLTLRDVQAFRASDGARLQAAIYPITQTLLPRDPALDPLNASGYAVTADFFQMLDVPFRYGASWSKASDKDGANEVVVGEELNRKVFGGRDSVGQEIRLDGHIFRIVGVLRAWNPRPRFYAAVDDLAFDPNAPQIFMPFQRALDLKVPSAGSSFGPNLPEWDMTSEKSYISYWVELPDAASVGAYKSFLRAYAQEQWKAGRFQWPAKVELRDQAAWLEYQHIVPAEARISFIVALGILVVCAVNTVGLLLARYMRRSGDIGVRRALGGSRSAILVQYLTEAGVIGLAGGLLGTLLTIVFLSCMGLVFPPEIAGLAHMSWVTTILPPTIALVMVLIAALYPVYRASRVEPSWQLKSS